MEDRRFFTTRISAGFAAAARPIAAHTTILTAAAGLEAGDVKIPTSDGTIPGYRALPAKGAQFPVVLVVQEIFGVHEHIRDLCRRFAKVGYLAVAPELYARQGAVHALRNIQDVLAIAAKVPDAQVMSDLDATVEWAEKSGKGDTGRLGLTGFCWGGRVAWLYAAHNPRLKAAVAWYGRLAGSTDALHPRNPIDVAGELRAPVLGLYGGKDQGIPLDTVEPMRGAVAKAGKTAEIVVYPDAGHGFNADYRQAYDRQAAEDGWKRLQQWFKKYGAA